MSATTEVTIDRPADQVFEVLSDPTTFPDWLVGAQRIVRTDATWPAVGSRFHHRVGWGPLRVPGSTTVRRCSPPRLLQLSAGIGPFGEAIVTFRLDERDGRTVVAMDETPRRGIAGWAEHLARPLVAMALWGRNSASLDMLADLVERRSADRR